MVRHPLQCKACNTLKWSEVIDATCTCMLQKIILPAWLSYLKKINSTLYIQESYHSLQRCMVVNTFNLHIWKQDDTYLPTAIHLGYFYSFLERLVGLSLIHSLSHIFQICPLFLKSCHSFKWFLPHILTLTDWKGCENWVSQNIWDSDHSLWKILVGKSVICPKHCDSKLYYKSDSVYF